MLDNGPHRSLAELSLAELKTEILHPQKVSVRISMPDHMILNMSVYETKCHISQEVIVQFETYIAEQSSTEYRTVESRRFPLNWFEHFKERWFPLFLLTKYPVKYKVIDTKVEMITKNMYPHITVPHPVPRNIVVQKYNRLDTPNWR